MSLHLPLDIVIYVDDLTLSFRIKIEFTFIFRFHRHPIQLIVFVLVGLSSFLHLWLVLLGVEVSSVARPGQLTVGVQIVRTTKCYRNEHKQLNGTTVKPESKGNSNFDSN